MFVEHLRGSIGADGQEEEGLLVHVTPREFVDVISANEPLVEELKDALAEATPQEIEVYKHSNNPSTPSDE